MNEFTGKNEQMISDGAPVGQSKLFSRPKHSRAPSDTAFGSSDRANLKPGPG
jgi:hypothetical protein